METGIAEGYYHTHSEILRDLERKLRQPETDRAYLTSQLVVLAQVAALDVEREEGLTMQALGGILYCIERLREYRMKDGVLPALSYLRDCYAELELSRYATTDKDVVETAVDLKRRNLLEYHYRVEGLNGKQYTVFVSERDQTTLDGHRIMRGEMLESVSSKGVSFSDALRQAHEFKS